MIGKPAKPGKTRYAAVLPSGALIRPYGEHLLCLAIPLSSESSIIVMPEKHRAPYGSHATGHPVAFGKVLACGHDVEDIEPGEFVLIHPLNTNTRRIEGSEYYLPLKKAIYVVVAKDGA